MATSKTLYQTPPQHKKKKIKYTLSLHGPQYMIKHARGLRWYCDNKHQVYIIIE